MKKEHAAVLAAVSGYAIWGFSFLFTRVALEKLSPMALMACRFLVALLAMSALLLTGKFHLRYKGKNLRLLALLSLFQPVLYFLCETYGVKLSSATFSGVMVALIPIATLFFGGLFLHENPTRAQVLFSVLSVAGVVFLSLLQGGEGGVTLPGALLMAGAVLTGALFNLLSRKSSKDFTAFERTYAMFIVGTVFFGAMALFEAGGDVRAIVTPLADGPVLATVLYLGVLASVGAFFGLNFANTYLPVARVSAFNNLTTVISLFAGILFLREPFTLLMLPAAAMIVAGVWGVQRFAAK